MHKCVSMNAWQHIEIIFFFMNTRKRVHSDKPSTKPIIRTMSLRAQLSYRKNFALHLPHHTEVHGVVACSVSIEVSSHGLDLRTHQISINGMEVCVHEVKHTSSSSLACVRLSVPLKIMCSRKCATLRQCHAFSEKEGN